MQESEASLLAVHEHLRPHICAEAADRFHKRVRRIHDPVKIVVPCVVVEVEIPIPLDRSVHLVSYNWVFADAMHQHAIRQVWGKKKKNWKNRKRIKGVPQLSLISHFSHGVRKYRVHSRCFSQPFAKLRALIIEEMIDKGEETVEAFTKK
ncbi:hypothetical protein F2Q70_00043421 [Brassica cretica]|uniref:Uncharacterized protein n=1 Tax=Brassica cretica TaxID=69181 RepID=A0A8S9KMZ4_BRACR|nr:hypothetical protein F2Q70_00043421 [Brassica cretica]